MLDRSSEWGTLFNTSERQAHLTNGKTQGSAASANRTEEGTALASKEGGGEEEEGGTAPSQGCGEEGSPCREKGQETQHARAFGPGHQSQPMPAYDQEHVAGWQDLKGWP